MAKFKHGWGASLYHSTGMRMQGPISCDGGDIQWSNTIKSLGCPKDAENSHACLMKQIERTALSTWRPSLTSLVMLGLPATVCTKAYNFRVLPRALFSSELVVLCAGWEKRADALQDKMIRMMFGLDAQCARVRLLLEAGVTWRLSSRIRLRALSLEARIALLPE